MSEGNQINEVNTRDSEYVHKKKTKEEAIMRYINEPENSIYDDFQKEPEEKGIKGLIIGFFYIVYVIFLHPVLSDKALKRRILFRIIFLIAILLICEICFQDIFSSVREIPSNVVTSD